MKRVFIFMNRMKILLALCFAFLIIFPLNAFAGDLSEFNFIGFSKDGKYLAFEEYGEWLGEGGPDVSFSNYFVIDVEKNRYAINPIRISIEKQNALSTVRSRARLKAAPTLKKFGIIPNNTGQLMVSRMLTDKAYQTVGNDGESIKVGFSTEIDLGMGSPEGKDFEINLKTLSSKETGSCGNLSYRMELSIKDLKTKTEKFLHKDNDVPKERNCPFYYGIQYIYLYQNSLVVFLNSYVQGFESRDMHYLAVTGKIVLN